MRTAPTMAALLALALAAPLRAQPAPDLPPETRALQEALPEALRALPDLARARLARQEAEMLGSWRGAAAFAPRCAWHGRVAGQVELVRRTVEDRAALLTPLAPDLPALVASAADVTERRFIAAPLDRGCPIAADMLAHAARFLADPPRYADAPRP